MRSATRPLRGRPSFALLGAAAVLVVSSFEVSPRAADLALNVQRVPLNPNDPEQTVLGPLRFRGGVWLRSAHPGFGGFSGLWVSEDGSQVLAVSDCGRALVATLGYDPGGDLVDVQGAILSDLPGPGERALERGEIDAEGLAPDGDRRVLVLFEHHLPRIWSYEIGRPLSGPPEPRGAPPFGPGCDGNRGPEALATLADGELFVACEGRDDRATAVWMGRDRSWRSLSYRLDPDEGGQGEVYRPTGAALLPDGDLLVLERRFPPLGVRLVRLPKDELAGPGPLIPVEVVRLAPPLTLDNFEGLDVRRDASGATLIYLVSDDNGCGKRVVVPGAQRTLLLQFELLNDPPPSPSSRRGREPADLRAPRLAR